MTIFAFQNIFVKRVSGKPLKFALPSGLFNGHEFAIMCQIAMKLLCGVASSFILLGVTFLVAWLSIFESVWTSMMTLSQDSASHKLWVKTPMPLYMELHLFNWTNPEEFMKNKATKPNFKEVGPFIFKEVHEKVNVTWNNTFSVTYNQTRTWTFVPERSVKLSTPITNLNVVLYTIAQTAASKNFILKELIDFLIHQYKEKLIITRPANEWLFDGMNDALLDFIKKFNPKSVPYDKFGWFYGRNKSAAYDGIFNVKTGKDNIYNLGSLRSWNNKEKTDFFSGECGLVKGSTTELFPPLKNRDTSLCLFISDFCGYFTLTKNGSKQVKGLNGYHFVGDDRIFDNGTKYSDSKCFCNGSCSPSGVRNETSCLGAPLFISFPHFYLADPVYVNSVTGLTPNKSEHEFYLTIHPLSGLPLEVRAQLQINVGLNPIPSIPTFSHVPHLYVPMMWFRQTIEVTPTLVNQGFLLEILKILGYIIGCTLIFIGSMILIIPKIINHREKVSDADPLIATSAEAEEKQDVVADEPK